MIRHDAVRATARTAQRLSCPPTVYHLWGSSPALYTIHRELLSVIAIAVYNPLLQSIEQVFYWNMPKLSQSNKPPSNFIRPFLIDSLIHSLIILRLIYMASPQKLHVEKVWNDMKTWEHVAFDDSLHRTLSWGRLQLNRKEGRKPLSRMSHIKRIAPPEQQNWTMDG